MKCPKKHINEVVPQRYSSSDCICIFYEMPQNQKVLCRFFLSSVVPKVLAQNLDEKRFGPHRGSVTEHTRSYSVDRDLDLHPAHRYLGFRSDTSNFRLIHPKLAFQYLRWIFFILKWDFGHKLWKESWSTDSWWVTHGTLSSWKNSKYHSWNHKCPMIHSKSRK